MTKNMLKTNLLSSFALCTIAIGCCAASAFAADADSDWLARSSEPGVLMATRFETEAEVTDGLTFKNGSRAPDADHVSWQQSGQASGNGCMRMDVLKTDTSESGQWWRYLADDQTTFGTGDTIYVQYRAYFPAYYATHHFATSSASGWKVSIISNADGSNQLYEVVHQNTEHRGWVQGYNRDTNGTYPPWQDQIDTPCNPFDFVQQNVIDRNPGVTPQTCLEARQKYGGLFSYNGPPYPDPETGAFIYYPDEWLTFLQKVTYGSFGSGTADTHIEMWAAREADTTYTKLIDRMVDLGSIGGDGPPDSLWLLPYDTNRRADSTRQNTYTLYDEVIVSTDFIPAPNSPVQTDEPIPARILDLRTD